jgi:hypothetical protein
MLHPNYGDADINLISTPTMTQPISTIDFLAAARGDRAQRHLEKVPGMKFVCGHKCHWTVGEFDADVVIEPGDVIHVALDVANPPSDVAALNANCLLPGNLRFARCQHRPLLLADTQLDGVGHLLRTFDDLSAGLRSALGHVSAAGDREPLAAADVRSAIESCGWPEESILQLDEAWEFRTRLRGDATPVRAVIDGAEIRMSRRVVADIGEGHTRDAICAQALRFNKQLRYARLAIADGAVVAESRLHGKQLTPAWLETAAWAVAVACRHTEVVLNILAENDEVAADYVATF